MSPLALRKRYLPRRRADTPAVHPQAAPAAEKAQATPPPPLHRAKTQTEIHSTPNRSDRITLERFKEGFELETEKELSIIFHRPMRTYKQDPPFYPWLPPEPYVNFNLNYKF